ncbi:hypothetical protein IU433_07130 [Nocardia puris]|nr:hypothetical protein [Nocardia puris]
MSRDRFRGFQCLCARADRLDYVVADGREEGESMVRRAVVLVALMVAVVACDDGVEQQPTSAVPGADKLNRLRSTDICALLPESELAKLGPVAAVGTDWLYECEAAIGDDLSDPDASVEWVVRAVENTEMDQATNITIDGMSVTLLGDHDVLSEEELADRTFRMCSAYAQLPTGGSIDLTVELPPGTEPCPVAQSLVTVALSEWKRFPKLGDSPHTVRTVVTGADPCDVLTELPDARVGDNQWVDRCWFQLDGDSLYVEYGHSTDREFTNYKSLEIDGRRVYRTSDEPNGTYKVRVGPTFDPVADGYEFESVPAVSIAGAERETIEKVTAAVLTLFPDAD